MGERGDGEGRRHYPSVFWPLLLIAAGVLLLLNSLGYIDLDWSELWRFWPVLLILIGLDLLLGRRSWLGNLVVLLLTIAVLGGCIVLLARPAGQLAGGVEVDRIVEPLEGAERATLRVEPVAGKLTVSRLEDSSSLVEAELDLATDHKPAWQVERDGDQASLRLAYKSGTSFSIGWGKGETWDLRLSPAVVWEVEGDLAAGEGRLDLTGIDLDGLALKLGAGQYVVTLPEKVGGKVTIKGGAGDLVLKVPEELAARVSVKRGIAPVSMSDRFEKKGDVYVTRDWETSTNRVEIEINLGVGGITVQEP